MAQLPLVRLAAPEDEGPVLEMCERLHQENGLFALSLDKVRDCLKRYFEKRGVIVGVIGMPGKLQASTCLELTNFYYTDDWHLAELWNYVEEPYRVSKNAEALIQFGKSCAEQMMMPFFTGIITNRQMAGKVRLYRRSLGQPVGAFFVHNSNWQTEPMADHSAIRVRLQEMSRKITSEKRDGSYANLVKAAKLLKEVPSLIQDAVAALDEIDRLWGTKTKATGTEGA